MVGGRTLTREVTVLNYTPPSGIWAWWTSLEPWKQYTYGGVAGGISLLALVFGVWAIRRRGRPRGEWESGDHPITTDPLPAGLSSYPQTEPLGETMVGGTLYGGPTAPLSLGSGASNKATRILASRDTGNGQVYAWLTRLDSSDRLPIRETSVRIGRHEDNDLKLDEESVHRRHAVVHMTPQREFVITDLSGNEGNHVYVNDQRCEKKSLRDGDVIKLGKVQLRFQVATV